MINGLQIIFEKWAEHKVLTWSNKVSPQTLLMALVNKQAKPMMHDLS
jgi:hypothetical protein